MEVARSKLKGVKRYRVNRFEIGDVALDDFMRSGELRYLRMSLSGKMNADAKRLHPLEHFRVRKARYRWTREMKKLGSP